MTLAIVLVTARIYPNYDVLAYAQDSISVTCGPTQQSNLSISMTVDEFIPKSFIHYKFRSMVDSQRGLMVKTR